MYSIEKKNGFEYITFPILKEHKELLHCFTTRKGGVSKGPYESMNLGQGTDDEIKNVKRNYRILTDKLGIDLKDIVKPYQSHTNEVRYVDEKYKGWLFKKSKDLRNVDGLITDRKNLALITIHADCTPLFFYDPVKKAAAMVHAGWRGTVDDIGGRAVESMIDKFGSNPGDIKVVIGPSLGQCCFEVDEDVAEIFLNKDDTFGNFMIKKGVKFHFDLWEINKYLLMRKGLKESNIEVSGLCTKCRNDLLFSHRGQKGKRGLMAGLIMMK